jgi:hypothetical protein
MTVTHRRPVATVQDLFDAIAQIGVDSARCPQARAATPGRAWRPAANGVLSIVQSGVPAPNRQRSRLACVCRPDPAVTIRDSRRFQQRRRPCRHSCGVSP